jgi:bacterioferritin-associated ferredoxin
MTCNRALGWYEPGADGDACGMYVCLCNQLTDRDVREAATAGARRPSEVYRACGCAMRCGSCTRTLRQIVEETVYPLGRPTLAAAE